VDDGWVDYRTAVLDHHVPRDLDQSHFGVDLDDAGVRCKLPTSTFAVPPAGLDPAAYRLGDCGRGFRTPVRVH